MRVLSSLVLSSLLACAPAGGGAPSPAPCPEGTTRTVRDVLYFGRSIPGGGMVSDSAWSKFVAEVITPAFPEGFTVTSGTGQWQEAGGNVVSEPSMILSVTHPETQEAEAALLGVGERYRVWFHQEAVLHEHTVVCVSLIDGTP